MVIYTRIGDQGETSLIDGSRLSKGSMQMGVIGAVDELNSSLGLAVGMMEAIVRSQELRSLGVQNERIEIWLASLVGQLRDVQRELFEVGVVLAANCKLQITNYRQNQKFKIKNQELRTERFEMRNLPLSSHLSVQADTKLKAIEMQRMAEEFVQGKHRELRIKNSGYPSEQDRQELKTNKNEVKYVEERKEDKVGEDVIRFDVVRLESLIDEMEQDLPRLESFILPGGGVIGAQLMVARSICRRAEREYVRFLEKFKRQKSKNSKNIGFQIPNSKLKTNFKNQIQSNEVLRYLNRLSDYLFVASRWVNWTMREKENVWRRNF